jgi:hypothetical protein
MANHTGHQRIWHTLPLPELGSINADLLRRADRKALFLPRLLNNRGEERFTPALHGGLQQSLHWGAATIAREFNPIHTLKKVGLHATCNDPRAGTHDLPISQKSACCWLALLCCASFSLVLALIRRVMDSRWTQLLAAKRSARRFLGTFGSEYATECATTFLRRFVRE